MKHLFRIKNVSDLLSESEAEDKKLNKVLGVWDLIALGVASVVGTGIFATIGTAVAGGHSHVGAGPAIVFSFVIAALACLFTLLCYAELASMIPVSGSAYTYSYATMGELTAWIIGWDLTIEYGVSAVAIAISWSEYLVQFLNGVGINMPLWLCTNYRDALMDPQVLASAPYIGTIPIVFNLPAVLIVLAVTALLVVGIKESAKVNNMIVILKIGILLFFIFAGLKFIRPENWSPFMPNGWNGVLTGTALIFFAYIGVDAVSTTAEETKDPARDLPRGMIGTLIVSTVFYIAIALVLTGMAPYSLLGTGDPLARVFAMNNVNWIAGIISAGAVVSLASVILVVQLGQTRVFYVISRDGLLPPFLSKVHPKFKTPHIVTIVTGIVVAFFSAFANINEVVELCNIGTLFAFILVCVGVIILRKKEPERQRAFKCPYLPWIPILGIGFCIFLMLHLPLLTWLRFAYWLIIGLLIYFFYGALHSKLNGEDVDKKAIMKRNSPWIALTIIAFLLLTWYVWLHPVSF